MRTTREQGVRRVAALTTGLAVAGTAGTVAIIGAARHPHVQHAAGTATAVTGQNAGDDGAQVGSSEGSASRSDDGTSGRTSSTRRRRQSASSPQYVAPAPAPAPQHATSSGS